MKEKRTFFISGHRDLSHKEFETLYVPAILNVIDNFDAYFLIGEYEGADIMSQNFLAEIKYPKEKVSIYHMNNIPRCYNEYFKESLHGGYADDIARDSAMTFDSDEDIAFVRYGRYGSGTSQNVTRRVEFISKGDDIYKLKK